MKRAALWHLGRLLVAVADRTTTWGWGLVSTHAPSTDALVRFVAGYASEKGFIVRTVSPAPLSPNRPTQPPANNLMN